MTRSEHIQWCKDRALEYCDKGDLRLAYMSMASDLQKHDETNNHSAIRVGMVMFVRGVLNTDSKMRKFINEVY